MPCACKQHVYAPKLALTSFWLACLARIDGSSHWIARRVTQGAFILGLCLSAFSLPAMAAGTVQDVSLLPHGDGVRVVIELGRAVPYEQRTLDRPPRLVVDLPDVAWQLPSRRSTRSYRFIRGFRFGKLQDGISRLVLDADRPFEIEKIFELPPSDSSGHRIVTDLLPLPFGSVMTPQRLRGAADVEVAGVTGSTHLPKAKPRETQRVTRRTPERQPVRVRPGNREQRAGRVENALIPKRRPGSTPRTSLRAVKRMIVLDPGHGGIDPGASGKRGTYEKNVVLSTVLELRQQLLDTGRYDVVLTRGDDSFVRLRDRLQIARASDGDLFLSLHADSLATADDVHGAAVYTLSDQASSEEAARLAGNENRADILGGIDLSRHEPIVTQILIDLAQRDANSKSLRIGDILVEALADVTKMLRKQRQQAGFVVLKSPDMPSALVELGYLSNASDEKRLNDPNHLADLAGAMLKAIDRYFEAEQS
ncbi:MAG: N-acetylmuramoyl-L-alanine amidase [Geminicoccales bacterium]